MALVTFFIHVLITIQQQCCANSLYLACDNRGVGGNTQTALGKEGCTLIFKR